MENQPQKCQSCARLIFGRTDKRFCCDACRNIWNNKNRHRAAPSVKLVNRILKRNRDVLRNVQPEGKRTFRIRKAQLEVLGFNFSYFTGACNRRNGSIFFFCYEYGYSALSSETYYIIKKQPFSGNGLQ
jgi:predicted nucleic acid-binding Zn ribbon protein